MVINGKDFRDFNLWQKILAILAVPVILIGVTGFVAFIFFIITATMALSIPLAIFKKLKDRFGGMNDEK